MRRAHALALTALALCACLAAAALPSAAAPGAPPAAGARVAAARAALDATTARFAAGQATAEDCYLWSTRLMTSEREAGAATAAQDHLGRMAKLETEVKAQFSAGLVANSAVLGAAYYRVEAEAWAAR
jgi:hypothetical protein